MSEDADLIDALNYPPGTEVRDSPDLLEAETPLEILWSFLNRLAEFGMGYSRLIGFPIDAIERRKNDAIHSRERPQLPR